MGHSVEPERWAAATQAVLTRLAGRFLRVETRARFGRLLHGMLAPLPRKNCWTIAEHAGDRSPDGMQHLLNWAVWDTDAFSEDLRDYAPWNVSASPDAVLVVDETGDLKKGEYTVGVQRQYSGTAGRVENAAKKVVRGRGLSHLCRPGRALDDRSLTVLARVLGRRHRAPCWRGVPEHVEFATQPALAAVMITRAIEAGAPARWLTGDEVYGADPQLRAHAERLGYELGSGATHACTPTVAGYDPMRSPKHYPQPVGSAAQLGSGRKGPGASSRLYEWAWVTLTEADGPGHRWLLIRRHPRTGELAFYRCYSPVPVGLPELVRVPWIRPTIEERFQTGKGLVGPDEHQHRRWLPWRRWSLIAMLAHAIRAVMAAVERARQPAPTGLIALTCNEIAHLFNRLVIEPTRRTLDTTAQVMSWTNWRCRHQHRSRTSHYKARPET